MQIAQRLYEGVDIGGETVGLITYMRTDGVAISAEAIAAARELIGKEFGAKYVPDTPRHLSQPRPRMRRRRTRRSARPISAAGLPMSRLTSIATSAGSTN